MTKQTPFQRQARSLYDTRAIPKGPWIVRPAPGDQWAVVALPSDKPIAIAASKEIAELLSLLPDMVDPALDYAPPAVREEDAAKKNGGGGQHTMSFPEEG